MFENISSLSIIGVGVIVLSFVRYSITRDKAERLILFSMGLALFGFSLIVHYIIVDDAGNIFLIVGVSSIIFTVLPGLRGIYELGTGKPRTFLLANQKIHIIGSVVQKLYNWKDHYCFKAVTDVNNLSEVPVMYAIPTTKFSKVPSENSTFGTDKKGKIEQDTIKGRKKQDIII